MNTEEKREEKINHSGAQIQIYINNINININTKRVGA